MFPDGPSAGFKTRAWIFARAGGDGQEGLHTRESRTPLSRMRSRWHARVSRQFVRREISAHVQTYSSSQNTETPPDIFSAVSSHAKKRARARHDHGNGNSDDVKRVGRPYKKTGPYATRSGDRSWRYPRQTMNTVTATPPKAYATAALPATHWPWSKNRAAAADRNAISTSQPSRDKTNMKRMNPAPFSRWTVTQTRTRSRFCCTQKVRQDERSVRSPFLPLPASPMHGEDSSARSSKNRRGCSRRLPHVPLSGRR